MVSISLQWLGNGESPFAVVCAGALRLPPYFDSISLHRVADLRRISFKFRCIEFGSCKKLFGVVGERASQVTAVFRFNFVAAFWSDWPFSAAALQM